MSDAAAITDWQTCERKWSIGRKWMMRRWRPKHLADTLLRRGIVAIAAKEDPVKVALAARRRLLEIAVDPGFDMVADPYKVAHDWAAVVEIILRYQAHVAIPLLYEPAVYTDAAEKRKSDWKFNSWADESGQLHRWLTVDHWDDEALHREAHSWRTIGDIAAARQSMMLHVFDVGQSHGGRHSSTWTRAYRHPVMTSLRPRFAKPQGSTYKPFYFVDQTEYSAAEWIAMARSERAFDSVSHVQIIDCPPDEVCQEVEKQITAIEGQMAAVAQVPWRQLPMSRGACDLFFPCPYQNICYDTARTPIDRMGLYIPRNGAGSNGGAR